MTPTSLEMLSRLGAAVLLGGLLGLEREVKKKPAGLRTHMMVSLAAACFTLASFGVLTDSLAQDHALRVDPLRIVEAVAGGIGFLGAGVILREAGSISGLTTAGSLWLVGAVGLAAGAGHYVLAAEAALIALLVLHAVGWMEERWIRASASREGEGGGDP